MARCKDCVHYEACSAFSKIINSAREVEKGCEYFKDRTKYVEVVRCKDCKHCTVTADGMICECALPTKQMMDYYIYGSTILAKVEAEDFCSRGERKE